MYYFKVVFFIWRKKVYVIFSIVLFSCPCSPQLLIHHFRLEFRDKRLHPNGNLFKISFDILKQPLVIAWIMIWSTTFSLVLREWSLFKCPGGPTNGGGGPFFFNPSKGGGQKNLHLARGGVIFFSCSFEKKIKILVHC